MRRTVILAGLALASVLAGAVAFSLAEHVPFWLALYFSVATATTVGYGDITPATDTGRVIAVAVMLTAIPLLAATFSALTAMHIRRHVSRRLDDHLKDVREHVDRALEGRDGDHGAAP